jgi:hypothetical protein
MLKRFSNFFWTTVGKVFKIKSEDYIRKKILVIKSLTNEDRFLVLDERGNWYTGNSSWSIKGKKSLVPQILPRATIDVLFPESSYDIEWVR